MRQAAFLLLCLAAGATAHAPLFADISASASRVVDAPHKASVSQVLYGKLLPGQELCLRAAEPAEAYFELDFVSTEASAFRGHLKFSLQCEGAAVAAVAAVVDDGSYVARDATNDYQHTCSTGGTFATGNHDTLTPAQKEEVEELYPGELPPFYACAQGCPSGTCTATGTLSTLAGVKAAKGALCKLDAECASGYCYTPGAAGSIGACRAAPVTASVCASDLPGKVEPFTQSAYHSVAQSACGAAYIASSAATAVGTFPPTLAGSPKMLRPVCPPGDRVRACIEAAPEAAGVTLGGIVVGRQEEFSPKSLVSFPLYVSRLHGSYGNRDYVLPYVALTLVGAAFLALLLRGGLPLPGADYGTDPKDGVVVVYMLRQAAGAFALAAADACYHAGRTGGRLGVMGDEAWELAAFMSLVVGVAHLIPMALCLRFAHTGGFREPTYCWDVAPALLLIIAVDGSLFVLGTEVARIAIIAAAACALVVGAIMAWLQRPAALLAVLVAHLCLTLMFFLGSGYWIGPALLGMALLFSLLWCPGQWWPEQCPCRRRHSVEMRQGAAAL